MNDWIKIYFRLPVRQVDFEVFGPAQRLGQARGPPMAVQYTGHVIQTKTCDNDTALPLVEVLVT